LKLVAEAGKDAGTQGPTVMQQPINTFGWIIFRWVMPAGFVLGGVWLIAAQTTAMWRGLQSRSWPTTAGTIVYAGWQSYQRSGAYIGPNYNAAPFLHQPDIHYRYEVNGRVYEGSRVSLHDHRDGNLGNVKAIVERYPVGSAIEVYFDPSEPSQAILEPGVAWFNVLFLGMGVVFVLVGFGLGWAAVKVRQRLVT